MSKVKIKQVKQTIGDGKNVSEINSLFEEMLGLKDCDSEIILPKFVKTRNLLRHLYKVLLQFSTFTPIQSDFPETIVPMKEINNFIAEMKTSIKFGDGADETAAQYATLTKEDLNAAYKTLKEHKIVRQLIILCGKLKQYSRFIEDKENLKDNFIGQEPGLSLTIFPFSTLDLKKLWASPVMKAMIKKYILNILHAVYTDLFALYQTTTSPDVDLDKFTSLLMDSLKKLRTQPGLNRCNNAFNRIERSVELLKENFGGYYRESIASANPNIIMESYIIDVSNQGGSKNSASLTREFRIIIQYMHKLTAQNGKNNDPAVTKLFSMLNKTISMEEPTTETTPLDDKDFSTKE